MRLFLVSIFVLFCMTLLVPAVWAQEPPEVCTGAGITPWQETTPLPAPIFQIGVAAYSDTIYLIGGRTDEITTSVLYARPLPDGTIDEWRPTAPLNFARSSPTVAISGSVIYVVGTGVMTPEMAIINPDGSLGAWQVTVEDMPPIQPPTSGYYYRLDYANGLVERSQNQTTWQPLNRLLPPPYLPGIAEVGDYVYIIGGNTGGGLIDQVFYWNTTTPPIPSDYGVSINDGALFTNQVTVTLTVGQPPLWNQLAQVSNDGGFAGSIWRPYNPCQPWTITRYGNYIIPRTVYVRFKDASSGQLSATFSDDIILDETPPEGTVEIIDGTGQALAAASPPITSQANYTVYLPFIVKTGPDPNVFLRLTAVDDVSGVAEMRVANVPGGGAWQPYRTNLAWYLPVGGTVYVQFKDWAGNVSSTYQAGR